MKRNSILLYVGLGVLAALALLTFLLWIFLRDTTYLIMLAVIGGLFLMYIALIVALAVAMKRSDTTSPYARVRSGQPLLLHLYLTRGNRLVFVLYEPFPADLFLQWFNETKGENADMGPPDSVYLGFTKMKKSGLKEVRGKQIVLSEELEQSLRADPALAEFFKKNSFFRY